MSEGSVFYPVLGRIPQWVHEANVKNGSTPKNGRLDPNMIAVDAEVLADALVRQDEES